MKRKLVSEQEKGEMMMMMMMMMMIMMIMLLLFSLLLLLLMMTIRMMIIVTTMTSMTIILLLPLQTHILLLLLMLFINIYKFVKFLSMLFVRDRNVGPRRWAREATSDGRRVTGDERDSVHQRHYVCPQLQARGAAGAGACPAQSRKA